MNDEVMRRISDAMDTDDGVAGDPELGAILSRDPEASRYAKHLSRMQRWMAAWPLEEPSEAELEQLAQRIDERLGEELPGDFTLAPALEEDEALARVSEASAPAADAPLRSDAGLSDAGLSDAGLADAGLGDAGLSDPGLELTMSAITELADEVNEKASAMAIGRVPLKRAGSEGQEPAISAKASFVDDLPAALPKGRAAIPRVPGPRVPAPTMVGNPMSDDAPSANIGDRGEPPAEVPSPTAKATHASAGSPPSTPAVGVAEPVPSQNEAEAPSVAPPPKSLEVVPPKPPEPKRPEPPAPPAPRAKAPEPKAPDLRAAATPAKPATKTSERVSIPVPAPTGPRLELLDGGRSIAPAPRSADDEGGRRGWLPALLAAAAVAVGVVGVGAMMSRGGAPTASSDSAAATGAVVPVATESSAEAPSPAAAPTVAVAAEPEVREGLAGALADPADQAAPPPPSSSATAPLTLAPATAAPAPSPPPSLGSSVAAGGSPTRTAAAQSSPGAPAPPRGAPGAPARPRGAPGAPAPPRGGMASDDGLAREDGEGSATSTRTATSGAAASRGPEGSSGTGRREETARARPAAEPTERPAATAPAHRAASSEPVGETLDRATVQSVMDSVAPAVRACAGERHGTAQVDVVVQGSGRVTSATVSGAFQGSAEGSCIARAVRSARFPAFTGEPLRFRYPYGI